MERGSARVRRMSADFLIREKPLTLPHPRSMRGDFFGGTVAALIAVPYGMALALAIGLRPEAGLYTSMIGGAVYGLLSRSPAVVSGLSATVVPILAALVKSHGVGAALAASFLCGLFMTLIGALRLGRFVAYLPQSIVSAFTSGLGVIIVTSQLKPLLGVQPRPAGFDLGVVDDLWAVAGALGGADPRSLLVAGLVVAAMLLLPRWQKQIPASLVGVALAAAVAYLCRFSLPQVGALPDSFPLPDPRGLDFSALSALVHPALTLAGLCSINQLLTVVVTDRESEGSGGGRFNRELVAQGAANMVAPMFGAPAGVAMLARSVASARAGAVSRWSVMVHSLVLLVFILPLRGLVGHIPVAALAAVTVVVGAQLADWRRFAALRRMTRMDAGLFLLTFGLVVFSDLIVGVGVGFLIAMLLFVERAAQATRLEAITTLGGGGDAQGYRLVGPLFFASSEKVFSQLSREVKARRLILDFAAAGPVDSAADGLLRRLARMQQDRGGELCLVGLDAGLYTRLEQGGLVAELPATRFNFVLTADADPSPTIRRKVHEL
jgi:SulP family sulfate permease